MLIFPRAPVTWCLMQIHEKIEELDQWRTLGGGGRRGAQAPPPNNIY